MSDFIYNQNDIPKDQWRYGLRSSAATGCGWIATYNALLLMGIRVDPKEIIRYYEKRFPLWNGTLGTFLTNPVGYFRRKGFPVNVCIRKQLFDKTAQEHDACILFFCWRKSCRFGAHYTALYYKKGQFHGFNTFQNSIGEDSLGSSLSGFIGEHRYFFPVLFGIGKKPYTE